RRQRQRGRGPGGAGRRPGGGGRGGGGRRRGPRGGGGGRPRGGGGRLRGSGAGGGRGWRPGGRGGGRPGLRRGRGGSGTEGSEHHVPVGCRAEAQASLLRAGGAGQDVLEVGGGAPVLHVEDVRHPLAASV